jgi:ParB family chromosome partitioning protein
METLPLKDIIVEDRFRVDYGDLESLKQSISAYGLIQPIVVDQNNRLIAGGRRYMAHQQLGLPTISVVRRETLSQDELFELELEENLRRKDMSWQEHCLGVAKIHEIKLHNAALNSTSWSERATGELLGVAKGQIYYAKYFAKKLADKASPYWQCEQMYDAIRLKLREEEDEALAELAKRRIEQGTKAFVSQAINSLIETSSVTEQTAPEDVQKQHAKERYLSNPHNNPDEFETYYAERQAQDPTGPLIALSNRLFNINCLDFMKANPARFDHIITDPPYGIDMAMLDQTNLGINNIDTVAETHVVKDNIELLHSFIALSFTSLKDQGFLVFWTDMDHWNLLSQYATSIGFAVQRWPLTWIKTHVCANNAAQYNTTKTTEIAMLCRKPGTVLAKHTGASHIIASHDDYKDQMQHPFVKPFDVWSFIIDAVSIPGQLILEPFAGEGSGVLSILRKDRHVIACELDTKHYNRLNENVRDYYLRLNSNCRFV